MLPFVLDPLTPALSRGERGQALISTGNFGALH